MSVRVLLVDDDALVRSALRMVLGGAGGIEVIGEAVDGAQAVTAAAELVPDVVLMDIRMPGVDGLAATEAILSGSSPRQSRGASDTAPSGGTASPGPPAVVVLTTFDADEHVLRALRAGAAGFVLKDTPPAQIVEAVRLAATGSPALSPSVARLLITKATEQTGDQRARQVVAALSERERSVVTGVGRGLSNADIGAQLHLSPATIKAHVSRLLTRLHLEGRVQLAVLARDAGLLRAPRD
ncbi:response regulator transcription factor [Quadrisphaera sp. INWT6]|uniref:response regulator transcription factor n=1 Tax=Quadrisphaera sp. INWT6 TaxID=2596917 RepID=UPI0028165765|nr:response regulator transcription factor [Quadrisphaera sp. INWT6]